MEFDNQYYMLVPLLLLLFWIFFKRYLKWNQDVFSFFGIPNYYNLGRFLLQKKISFLWFSLLIFSLSISLANPHIKTSANTSNAHSNILIILDLSNSMLVDDIGHSRLGGAKQLIKNVISNNINSNFGLITFAGNAYQTLPTTSNFRYFADVLNRITPDDFSLQGSNPDKAILLSMDYFNQNIHDNQCMIFISDGEFHNGLQEVSSDLSNRSNIKAIFVRVGTTKGGYLPESIFGKSTEQILSKAQDKYIMNLSSELNGDFFRLEAMAQISELSEEISKLIEQDTFNISSGFAPFLLLFAIAVFVLYRIF